MMLEFPVPILAHAPILSPDGNKNLAKEKELKVY